MPHSRDVICLSAPPAHAPCRTRFFGPHLLAWAHAGWLAAVACGPALVARADEPLRISASTAYLEPDVRGARVDPQGVRDWTRRDVRVLWFGEFARAGSVRASVELSLPNGGKSRLRLRCGPVPGASQPNAPKSDEPVRGETTREVTVLEATAVGNVDGQATADFGELPVAAGYQRFTLESLNAPDEPAGDLHALVLAGDGVRDAHFNLDPRRNAASVHLAYRPPAEVEASWFHVAVTAVEDPVHTFYMACGFHRGYFGMQVNSPTERRIIFSVWDAGPGTNANDRSEVPEENHVALLAKGEGVVAHAFGGEGTGGHSHLVYDWKTGTPQRFLLTAEPAGERRTDYSGYYFHPEQQRWMLIARMRAPFDPGGTLRGLHSFSENFGGDNGHLLRKARYGEQFIRSPDGQWTEILEASFSHDPTGREQRRDRFMGVEQSEFFLSHGGFVPGFTPFGERFTRPASMRQPQVTLK